MKRSEAAEHFTRLIDQLESNEIPDSQVSLMLTGRWYECFPPAPKPVALLPDHRGIWLLTIQQAKEIRDVLRDTTRSPDNVSMRLECKSDRRAVTSRQQVWHRERIRSIVRRTPGGQTNRYLRKDTT